MAERFIAAMEEFSIKKPPTPLLISFDAEELRKQAAASTKRFKEGMTCFSCQSLLILSVLVFVTYSITADTFYSLCFTLTSYDFAELKSSNLLIVDHFAPGRKSIVNIGWDFHGNQGRYRLLSPSNKR